MIGQHIVSRTVGTVRRIRLTVLPRAVSWRRLAVPMAAIFFVLHGPAVAQDAELLSQLERVRRELSDLQAYVYSGKAPSREAIAGAGAQSGGSASTARLQVQIQNLEEQIRTMTGRIEEMEYKVNRMTERVEKLVADMDVRFQALESGQSPGAAGPAGGAQRSEQQSSAATGTQVASTSEGAGLGTQQQRTAEGLAVGQQVLGTMSQSGQAQMVKPPLETLPEGANGRTAAAAPSGGQVATATGTPRERYDAAFGFLQRQEYDKAASAFDAFAKEYPDNPLSSNALYWLGETYYFRKDYADAARVFLDGYKKYPKGTKAPDNLLKLGKSLASINEVQPACAAWNKLLKSYPKANKRLLDDAKGQLTKFKCS